MEISERDEQILRHIVRYCNEVQESIHIIKTEEALQASFFYKNALSMPIAQIGELANHLTDDFTRRCPQIPWRAIVGMRNHFVHDYGAMDFRKVWITATHDIPIFRRNCEEILSGKTQNNEYAKE